MANQIPDSQIYQSLWLAWEVVIRERIRNCFIHQVFRHAFAGADGLLLYAPRLLTGKVNFKVTTMNMSRKCVCCNQVRKYFWILSKWNVHVQTGADKAISPCFWKTDSWGDAIFYFVPHRGTACSCLKPFEAVETTLWYNGKDKKNTKFQENSGSLFYFPKSVSLLRVNKLAMGSAEYKMASPHESVFQKHGEMALSAPVWTWTFHLDRIQKYFLTWLQQTHFLLIFIVVTLKFTLPVNSLGAYRSSPSAPAKAWRNTWWMKQFLIRSLITTSQASHKLW
jgi:hypothetical protein